MMSGQLFAHEVISKRHLHDNQTAKISRRSRVTTVETTRNHFSINCVSMATCRSGMIWSQRLLKNSSRSCISNGMDGIEDDFYGKKGRRIYSFRFWKLWSVPHLDYNRQMESHGLYYGWSRRENDLVLILPSITTALFILIRWYVHGQVFSTNLLRVMSEVSWQLLPL